MIIPGGPMIDSRISEKQKKEIDSWDQLKSKRTNPGH